MKFYLASVDDENQRILLKEGENFIGTKFKGKEFLNKSQEINDHHATITIFEDGDIALQTHNYDFPTYFINSNDTLKKLIPKKPYILSMNQCIMIGVVKFRLKKFEILNENSLKENENKLEKKNINNESKPGKTSVSKFLQSKSKSQIIQSQEIEKQTKNIEVPKVEESLIFEEEISKIKNPDKPMKISHLKKVSEIKEKEDIEEIIEKDSHPIKKEKKSKSKPITNPSIQSKKRSIPKSPKVELKNNSHSITPTTSRNRIKVSFSGVPLDKLEIRALQRIGITVITDKNQPFTALVMKNMFRSIKFLIAINKGIEILKYDWILDSLDSGIALGTEFYKLEDKGFEEAYQFKLESSLQKSRKNDNGFCFGKTFWFPNSIKPPVDDLYQLVESAGGEVHLEHIYEDDSKDILVLVNSHEEIPSDEIEIVDNLRKLSFKIYNVEMLLRGCLIQELEYPKFRID